MVFEQDDPAGAGAVPVQMLGTVSSTQDAARAALEGGKSGAAFALATTDQRSGRGRLGRRWSTPPGDGLALTLVHPTALPLEARSWCSLVTGLGVLAALRGARAEDADGRSAAAGLGLKWPNDVLTSAGRKLSGILLEAHGDALLVGVGVNLRGPVRDPGGAPVEGAAWLSGPDGLVGAPVNAEVLAALLAARIEAELRQLEECGGDALASGQWARYGEACITPGRPVTVEPLGAGEGPGAIGGQGAYSGTAARIDHQGRLCVVLPDGALRAVSVGDVRHARMHHQPHETSLRARRDAQG